MDDDEWEELDESAVEECMVLATQMCSRLSQNENILDHKKSPNPETAGKDYSKSITTRNYHNNPTNTFDDSGFSSIKCNSKNTASLLSSKIKNAGTFANKPGTPTNNSYSSRFNDFIIPCNTSQKAISGAGRLLHVSGKVYNSIPMKGTGGTFSSTKGSCQTTCPSGRLEGEENQQQLLKRTKLEKDKVEEDLILKQGEIALLRSELKRKEAILEAERLDHCTAIKAAENRGKEKVMKFATEAEAKSKESMKMVDKLQAQLLFKNREAEELLSQCRQLEQQTKQHVSPHSHRSPLKRKRIGSASPRVSPGKMHSNFASRFDFGGGRTSVCSVEVQTESSYCKTKVQRRLTVVLPRGEVSGSRRTAYLLSAGASTLSFEKQPTTSLCGTTNWSLPGEWSYLASQATEDSVNVENKLMTLALERLQEVHSLITSKLNDSNRSPVSNPASPVDWYESQVGPALHVLQSFMSPHNLTFEHKALQIIITHLSPLCIKEIVVNNRIHHMILETLKKVARILSPPADKVVCEQIMVALKDCCASIDSSNDILHVLEALVELSPHSSLTNIVCSTSGSCLVGNLCSCIDKIYDCGLTIPTVLLSWIMILVKKAPSWLQSTCCCSAKLLTTLLKQVHQALDFSEPERGNKKKEVYKLLLSSVRVLHNWSMVDPNWWEKVAQLPHYTSLMNFIIANAKDIQPDRQTVDLLCTLYEVEDGTFESC
ncbi:uncharacterized protein LOC121858302 [Homarus americanus]|uniref:uncharacterized protein LOC121858302 n=1 Tax=Homarus americanus TaxID=6706 RepID=UPI001C441C23|nr:uncharacterized protein LOC121858302 [Homarus americanus]XP_042210564.1 uncharacterized protein LOC121858302 [Homarus americanus]